MHEPVSGCGWRTADCQGRKAPRAISTPLCMLSCLSRRANASASCSRSWRKSRHSIRVGVTKRRWAVEAEHAEAQWLTEECEFSLTELVELSGSSAEELRDLVDYGAIAPFNPESSQWVFPGQSLPIVRTACRLRASFDLEPHGVALVIALLDRIRDLEAQIGGLRAQLPGRASQEEAP